MAPEELMRQQLMLQYESSAALQGFCRIAGVDEAGRGPLAGPVVAAACILPPNCSIADINDSKQIPPSKRQRIYLELLNCKGLIYAIGIASHEEIDTHNIYRATQIAMRRAVEALTHQPDYLLVDGMPLPDLPMPHEKIIKGDMLSLSIAAASIIAKETRDAMMVAFHEQWPHYGFAKHKGYGTAEHLSAIEQHGPCPIHRRSFAPFKCEAV